MYHLIALLAFIQHIIHSDQFLFGKNDKCPLVTVKANSLGPFSGNDLRITSDMQSKLKELKKPLSQCKIHLNVERSFTLNYPSYLRQRKYGSRLPKELDHLKIGNGIEVQIKDSSGKLICNDKCLSRPGHTDIIAERLSCLDRALSTAGLQRMTDLIYLPKYTAGTKQLQQLAADLQQKCSL